MIITGHVTYKVSILLTYIFLLLRDNQLYISVKHYDRMLISTVSEIKGRNETASK